eukprot:COSAG05_NODE_12952_length_447_cov_1.310345_2_plen_47_part_01
MATHARNADGGGGLLVLVDVHGFPVGFAALGPLEVLVLLHAPVLIGV